MQDLDYGRDPQHDALAKATRMRAKAAELTRTVLNDTSLSRKAKAAMREEVRNLLISARNVERSLYAPRSFVRG